MWAPLRRALAARCDAAGRRPPPTCAPGPPLGRDLRTQAERLAPTLPAGPLWVVGASYGGLLAWALSAVNNNVQHAMLIETLPSIAAHPRRLWVIGRALRAAPSAIWWPRWRARLAASLATDDASAADTSAVLDEAIGPGALLDRLDAIQRWGLPPRPACAHGWVLGQDRRAPWPALRVRQAHPNAPLERLPGCARPHIRAADALADALLLRTGWLRTDD